MTTIDNETATLEFKRWADAMRLKFFEGSMDNDDKKDFTLQKDRIIEAIMDGCLVVNDMGCFVFTPEIPEGVDDFKPITFHKPRGSALIAMDFKKKDKDMGKLFNSMGDMTKQHPSVFSKMEMPDLHICMAITTLFLA